MAEQEYTQVISDGSHLRRPARRRSSTDDLRDAERRLQAAQLAGNVAELDRLLDDRLIFTFAGDTFTKKDDLELHRTRAQVMTKIEEEELTVLVDGGAAVTWFLGTIEATLNGQPFAARMRYTRTWRRDHTLGWRVIAAHASTVG
jgi:ketosteroid isomerase-like protein